MNSRSKLFVVFASTSLVALLLVGAVVGRSASPDEPYKHIAVFTEVIQRIKSQYVEEPDMKNVTLGAVNGMLESIDPFASYLNAEQYKEYLSKKDAYKADVGLLLAKRAGVIGIVSSIPGSPAAQAGLTVGDWIESIKGIGTRDMPLAFAELMLKGDPGTTVEISVFRARRPEPQKFTLTRAVIGYPAATGEMRDDIGYIHTTALLAPQVREISAAIDKLQKQGAKKLLLDVRNCAVGSPEQGVALANLFLNKGLITYVQGQRMPRQNFDADPAKVKTQLPLTILANRGTANGAEVASAALLDSKRAEVIGERTYGSAAVRKAVPMDDGGAIILSVGKYYSPNGKSISDNGVTPSTLMPEPEAQGDVDDDGNPLTDGPSRDPKQAEEYLKRILTLIDKK
jgi:carboxyl-terminal processing protease